MGEGVEVVVCKSMTKPSATIFYIMIKSTLKKYFHLININLKLSLNWVLFSFCCIYLTIRQRYRGEFTFTQMHAFPITLFSSLLSPWKIIIKLNDLRERGYREHQVYLFQNHFAPQRKLFWNEFQNCVNKNKKIYKWIYYFL